MPRGLTRPVLSKPRAPIKSAESSGDHQANSGIANLSESSDAQSRKVHRYYRPELDVLRCTAFLLVFNHHVLPQAKAQSSFRLIFALQESGAAGVCLFFMLSAFLITELLLIEKGKSGTIHLASFYMRRILRIWPLYLLILAIAAILPFFIREFDPIGSFLAPYLLFCGNWAIAIHGWVHNPPLLPLWSISVEEQFYLLWPTVFKRYGMKGLVRISLLLLTLAWATDFLSPLLHASKTPTLWLNSLNQFQFFVLGTLLALFMHRRPFNLLPVQRLGGLAAGIVLFLLASYPFHYINVDKATSPLSVLAGYICIDLGCLAIFCSFLGMQLPQSARPFIYLGRISYGLYVFHYAVRSVVATVLLRRIRLPEHFQLPVLYVVTALLTVLLASLSYKYFEKPFLRFKKKFTFVPSGAS